MSRINVGVPVKNLIDQQLLAEHREIKRICWLFKKRLAKNKFDDIPDNYKLGEGSMKFFLDKGLYTHKRFMEILLECSRRGFNVLDFSDNWKIYHQNRKYANDFVPTKENIDETKERIRQRIDEMIREPRYCKTRISREVAKSLLDINSYKINRYYIKK